MTDLLEAAKAMTLDKKALGERIKDIRRNTLGLRQGWCAEQADMTQAQWANIERGRNMPTDATLARVAKVLGVTVRDLRGE